MNILFIYNNLNEINNIEQHLNNTGHKIFVANNYSEASEILLRVNINIIFCELISEKIDGIQILRRIKGSENFFNIPFVFVSSSLKDEEDIAFFNKLGAISVIEKPITYKGIQSIIEKDLTAQKLGFGSRQKILSDEEFIEEYSNILTKRIQKRVRELEADQIFIHNLINSIPSAIFLISQDFKIIDINEPAMKYLGITNKENIKGKFCYNIIYNSNKICNFEGHRCPILGVIKEKNSTEHYFITKNNGTEKHLNIHFSPVLNPQNNTILMLEHITDNTGIVEIINKSKENEFKLQTILNEARFGIILIENNNIININNAARELLDIKDDTFANFIKSIDDTTYKEMIDIIYQNVIFKKELKLIQNDSEKTLILEAQKITSLGKDYTLIIVYDNTENNKLIQDLKDQEQLQKTILTNIQDIFILIKQNTIIEVSRQIEDFTGKKRETYLKQNIFNVLPFIKESHLVDIDAKEVSYHFSPDKTIYFLMKIFPLYLKNEKYTLIQLTDITEEKERERIENQEKEKMYYIDRLDIAAKMNRGISQNINNFLAGINNFADYLLKPNLEPDKIRLISNIIKNLTKNAAGAISKVSNLLNSNAEELKPVDIQQIIDELTDIIKYSFPKNIEFRLERLSSHNIVNGDYKELLQSLLNIVINSAEAMPDGGTISISTQNDDRINLIDTGNRTIEIKISDTGKGIPEEIRSEIFKPYYSSKNGLKTGLGLSMVYNTIIKHNGTIRFESELNKGTTFIITLPTCNTPPTEIKNEISGNREKILIISEDNLEREIIKRILIKNNYDAYTAVDSLDAIESIKITRPSLIIMESTLKRLSALDTFDKITEIYPDIDIVLYTGLIFDDTTLSLLLKGIKSIIYKPLDINELIININNIIKKKTDTNNTPETNSLAKPKKILIIDDEEYILSALKMNLADRHEIYIETSGAKALDRLLNGDRFDKYIIDINMPDLNGLEFYNMIKEIDTEISKKVIFITGGITDDKIINEINSIKNDIFLLQKPFDVDELLKLLS